MTYENQHIVADLHLPVSSEGLSLPASLCRQASLGPEVHAVVYDHCIELRPARLTAEIILARAARYLLMNVGDQVFATDPRLDSIEGREAWTVPIYAVPTGEQVASLEIDSATGMVLAFHRERET